jgi:hypothetical protein
MDVIGQDTVQGGAQDGPQVMAGPSGPAKGWVQGQSVKVQVSQWQQKQLHDPAEYSSSMDRCPLLISTADKAPHGLFLGRLAAPAAG